VLAESPLKLGAGPPVDRRGGVYLLVPATGQCTILSGPTQRVLLVKLAERRI
jgi:hypothetical protein